MSTAALLLAGQVHAQTSSVQTGPVPEWVVESEKRNTPNDATGLVFVRRQDNLVHLHDEGQFNFVGQSFKILHPQALQAGNVAIQWDPSVGEPIVHRLLIHRDGAVIDVLEKAEFEVVRQEDQLEQAMLHGKLTALLRVPDLRVGDELELAFTTPSEDPTLDEKSFGILMLGSSPPPGRIRLGVSWEKGQEPAFKIPADLAPSVTRRSNSLDVVVDDAKVLTPPKDAPPRYMWQRMIEYSDFETWQTVSKTVDALFDEATQLEPESNLTDEIARIAAAYSEPEDRAQAALELVQKQVRYIYVGLAGGNLTPASADETWRRRYGDCKGKTALLLALLDGLGIESEAVLVNGPEADDGLDERLPSPGMFDHVIVRASPAGKDLWLDATLPHVYPATEKPAFAYRWALPLSDRGSELVRLPFDPPALPMDMGLYDIDARAGFDQPARIVTTNLLRGPEALVQYYQFSALTQDQILAAFRNNLNGGEQWNEVETVSYRFDESTQAGVLEITGIGDIDWDNDGGGAYSLALPGGGFSPPSKRQRASDQDQDAPFYSEPDYSCHVTTVRLPENTELENWGFNTVFDTVLFGRLYYRMMEKRDDGTIRMVRGSRTESPEISSETASRSNGRLDDFDNSKANIQYDPDRVMTPWGRLHPVPATYEIDWTGANPPCLPVDMLDGN